MHIVKMKIKYDKVTGFLREKDIEMIDDIIIDESDNSVTNEAGNIVMRG